MSLGIFKKLYDMLEEKCHEIDMHLFRLCVKHSEDNDDQSDNNFDQCVKEEYIRQNKVKVEKTAKQAELDQIEEELPIYLLQKDLQSADGVFNDMARRAFALRQELQEMVNMSGSAVNCKQKKNEQKEFLNNFQM